MSEQNNTTETANTENTEAVEAVETEQVETPTRKRGVKKAIIAGAIAVAVIAGGVGALSLPPVKDAISAAFVDATGIDNAPKVEDIDNPEEPIEEVQPIEGDTNGDGVLSEFEKQVLEAKKPKSYTMPDGTTVQVDPTKPLPQEVKDAVAAKVAPAAAGSTLRTTKKC